MSERREQTSEWSSKWPITYVSIHGCSEPQWVSGERAWKRKFEVEGGITKGLETSNFAVSIRTELHDMEKKAGNCSIVTEKKPPFPLSVHDTNGVAPRPNPILYSPATVTVNEKESPPK